MAKRTLLAGGAVAVAAAAAGLSAMSETVTTARIDSRFEGNDNYQLDETSPGDAFLWTNTLSFGMLSKTQTDTLDLRLSGDLRYADLPVVGTETAADNGTVNIKYDRKILDNSFTATFFMNDADVEYLDPLRTLDENGDFDDTTGSGRRNLATASVDMTLGADGPLRFTLRASSRNTDYRDTTDPDLVDQQRHSVNAELGLELSETNDLVLATNYVSSTRDDDDPNSETIGGRIGFDTQFSPRLVVKSRVGYERVESDYTDEPDKLVEDPVASLDFDYEMPNGSITGGAASRVTENGQRNQLYVGRSLTLPAGTLDTRVGVSNSDSTDIQPLFQIGYGIERPTSFFDLDFAQSVNVDSDGNDILNASLRANYGYAINPVSSLGLSAVAARKQALNEGAEADVTRMTLTASYDHSLTQDWAVSTGVSHQSRLEDEGSDARSNSVFLTLSRSFQSRR